MSHEHEFPQAAKRPDCTCGERTSVEHDLARLRLLVQQLDDSNSTLRKECDEARAAAHNGPSEASFVAVRDALAAAQSRLAQAKEQVRVLREACTMAAFHLAEREANGCEDIHDRLLRAAALAALRDEHRSIIGDGIDKTVLTEPLVFGRDEQPGRRDLRDAVVRAAVAWCEAGRDAGKDMALIVATAAYLSPPAAPTGGPSSPAGDSRTEGM